MKGTKSANGQAKSAEAPTEVCEGESEGSGQDGAIRRRVAGEAGFDVTYLRRRSERRAGRPILPFDADLEFAVVMHSTLFQSFLLSPHAGCYHLSELPSNQHLRKLCERGNTVLVVEHDRDVIKVADHVVDVGPHAGTLGGTIVSEGSYAGHLFNGGNVKYEKH